MGATIYNLLLRNFVLVCTNFVSFESSRASNIPLCKFECEVEVLFYKHQFS
jgi:hypothetical protein